MPKKLGKKIKLWRTEMSIRTRRRKAEKRSKKKKGKGEGSDKIIKDENTDTLKEKSKLLKVVEEKPGEFHFEDANGKIIKDNDDQSRHHSGEFNDKHISRNTVMQK